MDVPAPEQGPPATDAEQLALIQRYAQERDADERARILDQLAARWQSGAPGAERARLQTWLAGLPPADLEQTPAYARYRALLPRVLAGTLDAQDAPFQEFQAFIAQWDACGEEYQDLRDALDAGYAAWSTGARLPARFPDPDPTFLPPAAAAGQAGAQLAEAIWVGDLDWSVEITVAPDVTHIQFRFTVQLPLVSMPPLRRVAHPPPGRRRDLLAIVLGPDPAQGLPGQYRITLQAVRTDALTCRLLVDVGGPGLRGRVDGIRLRIQRPSGSDLAGTTDSRGTVIFPALPIADLDGLIVTISLPT